MPSAWLRGNKDSLRWHIHDVGRAKASQYQTSIPKLATAMIDPPVAMIKTTLAGGPPCASPYQARSCRHVGLAVSSDLTITSVVRVGLAGQGSATRPGCVVTR